MLREGEYMAGRYQLLRPIGKGGGGIVYLAEDMNLQKQVVIKQILNLYSSSGFLRTEVDILKRLHHAALPQVYDFLELDGLVFTVMEYIPGNNLQEYLKEGACFSQEQVLYWARQLADVLSYMHNQPYPVIHRDIKPSNVMIKPDGNLCLIDFNISEDSMQGRPLEGYSVEYASPEQKEKGRRIQNRLPSEDIRIDTRTDIYSFGAVLYRLLAGALKQDNGPSLTDLNCCWTPLAVITDKCMEITPDMRYQNADELVYALRHLEKSDQEYKKWNSWIHINRISFFILLSVGLAFFVYGSSINKKAQYLKDYEAYLYAVETHLDAAEKMGLDLLNDRGYQKILIHNPEDKADIFYYLACGYMEQQRYEKAVGYFIQALEIVKDNPAYYRDYAMALLEKGQIEEAKKMLNQAVYQGLPDSEVKLIKGQLAYQDGDYEQALENLRAALEEAENMEGKARAVTLYARTCLTLERYEEAKNILEEQYQNKKIEDYSLEDSLNLALAYQYIGEKRKSEDILLEARNKYPEEYRIDMRLSYLAYEAEEGKGSGLRDYSIAWNYYQEAKGKYRKEGLEKEKDEEWNRLETIMAKLKEYGWL